MEQTYTHRDTGKTYKKYIQAEVEYYRTIFSGLNAIVKVEDLELPTKKDIYNHVRAEKKRIASECKWNTPRDIVNYRIHYGATIYKPVEEE